MKTSAFDRVMRHLKEMPDAPVSNALREDVKTIVERCRQLPEIELSPYMLSVFGLRRDLNGGYSVE